MMPNLEENKSLLYSRCRKRKQFIPVVMFQSTEKPVIYVGFAGNFEAQNCANEALSQML